MHASMWSLKSSKVGADMTLAGEPFQRRTVDVKKDPLQALIEQHTAGIVDDIRYWPAVISVRLLTILYIIVALF